VEIARHVTGRRGGEWTKKVVAARSEQGGRIVDEADWNGFLPQERNGIKVLAAFLRVCESAESLDGPIREASSGQASMEKLGDSLADPAIQRPGHVVSTISKSDGLSRISESTPLATCNVAPRPRNLSQLLCGRVVDPRQRQIRVQSRGCSQGDMILPRSTSSAAEVTKSRRPGSTSATSATGETVIQTRFMVSVGWCIRYGCGSGAIGGRYQIVFLDGVALDVDVDSENVELRSVNGDVTRYVIDEL
jgi:hypothetical protein